MGSLRDLRSYDKNVHLLMTNSNLAELYVYDELKDFYNANVECIYRIENRQTFNQMLELVNVQPYLADKWIFVIQYKKVKTLLKRYIGIFRSPTSCFLVMVDNYKEFLEFREMYKNSNDMYLSIIRQPDLLFLFKNYRISQKILDFVYKAYMRDVDKIFVLKEALDNNIDVNTTKDVTSICGESASSTTRFVMLLLNEMPTSMSGLKRVYSKRIKLLSDMLDAFPVRTCYNYIVATVRDILDIKMLYLSGTIYDSIRNIPECYDEKRLSRYNIYLKKITNDLPYERILRLYLSLKENRTWYTENDALQFLYQYYIDSVLSQQLARAEG